VVWDTIPPWDKMESARLVVSNGEVAQFIKEQGAELLVPK
jgi:hypothetical protein